MFARNFLRSALALGGFAVLASCGGGGTSSPTVASFADLQDNFTDLANRANRLPNANIPSSGSASYAGSILVFESRDEITPEATQDLDSLDISFLSLGEVDIDVNFGAGSLTGTATNFYEVTNPNAAPGNNSRGRSINGELSLNDSGTVTGRITKLDGEVARYNLEDGDAGFVGSNLDIVLGVAIGQSRANGRATLNAGTTFLGERQ